MNRGGAAEGTHAASVAGAVPAADWNTYACYTLGFLTLISAFNYLDRSILGLALPLIKAQMHVSDTALGIVTGLAFAVFYSLFGVPIAALADRANRRNIIALGFGFWSVVTVLTGFVANIWQLGIARFLVGAGEACCLAPSNSMLADVFRESRRPLALAIFGMASSLAFLVFFPLSGWIGATYGWRAMFITAGLPGVLLVGVFRLTVREPARGALERQPQRAAPASLAAALRFLAGSRAYLLILLGATCMGANVYAAGAWNATFLTRVHHLSLTQIAAAIGPVQGVLGGVGIFFGGLLVDRMGRQQERWRLLIPALACALVAPSEALFLLGNSPLAWIVGLALTSLFTLVHQAPIFAVAMSVAQVRMRAVAISVCVLFASLLGQIVGPLLVGFLDDRLHGVFGEAAIRYSLLVNACAPLVAAAAFWGAVRYFNADQQRAAAAVA